MISKIATNTASYFIKRKAINETDFNIYKYGFELLISTILNTIGLFIISIMMDSVFETILFIAAFIPLRMTAGGYHAKNHWSCFLSTNITFFIFIVLLRHMREDWLVPFALLTIISSSLAIWTLSPVEAANKPLSEKKKDILRIRSIAIATINMAIFLLFMVIPNASLSLLIYYISGMTAASLSLVIAVLCKQTAFINTKR